jgi:hypothetical protein
LQQSKLDLEKTEASIRNIEKDTAYIGTYKPDSAPAGITPQEQKKIDDAYARIQAGEGTGTDYAILSQYGVDTPKAKKETGEYTQEQINTAFDNLPEGGGAVSQADWDALTKSGAYSEESLTDNGWYVGTPKAPTETPPGRMPTTPSRPSIPSPR